MIRCASFVILIFVLILITTTPTAKASWVPDGIPICTALYQQNHPQIASDGSGGAIITWQDHRSGNGDIYIQRVNSNGYTLWIVDGVAVCTASYNQYYPQIVSDGSGGAIITWFDWRSGTHTDIYAQRVASNGDTLWPADGVAVCTASYNQEYPQIVSDGSGGAIITWQDRRSGTNYDIYAQWVASNGDTLWPADGVAVCTASYNQEYPQIVSDGAGGTIITWQDKRSGTNYDIYAQKVDSSGNTSWTTDGVAVCILPADQTDPQLLSDGSGGAIFTWGGSDIFAQRVDSGGDTLWAANGVGVCTAPNEQIDPQLVSDGSGGAIITWQDRRSGTNHDIYAQKVDSSGDTLWMADGVGVCTAPNEQFDSQIVSDGSGGAIITWQDRRGGMYYDIYAQKVDSGGDMLWKTDGVGICTAPNEQLDPQIVSDGSGGAIFTWKDDRIELFEYDIYAQSSIDSIAPGAPEGFAVAYNTGSGNQLSWDPCTDSDFWHFKIYRDTDPDFVPEPGNYVQATSDKTWTDPEYDGWNVHYKITAVDYFGNESDASSPGTTTAVTGPKMPRTFALYQNVPNPFNPSTKIMYDVPESGGHVTLRIYDVAGRLVRKLVDGVETPGEKHVMWNGRNDHGSRVATGVYFYRMTAPGFEMAKKMILLQ